MKILVQKFGGSSVADIECMKKARTKVITAIEQGYKVVVVLSARSGQTNKLLETAYQYSDEPSQAELDVLLTTGEQESIALFTMLLHNKGIKARSMLGFQVPILTDNIYHSARIISIKPEYLYAELKKYDAIVIAGFQGISTENRITTLGRGGSDTSAIAIAAALGSVDCHVYTDVDGVYTTDPRIVPKAKKIPKISYEEMLEMASMGAKVLQIRSVEFAKKYKVPVWVRSTFSNDEGTLLTQKDKSSIQTAMVSSIAFDREQVKITLLGVPDKPGISSMLFTPLAENNILVDMIEQKENQGGTTDITYTVAQKDLKHVLAFTEKVCKKIGGKGVKYNGEISKISVIGLGMKNHRRIAILVSEALHKENINILMISTSGIKISCLIHKNGLEKAVQVLHTTFNLDSKE